MKTEEQKTGEAWERGYVATVCFMNEHFDHTIIQKHETLDGSNVLQDNYFMYI